LDERKITGATSTPGDGADHRGQHPGAGVHALDADPHDRRAARWFWATARMARPRRVHRKSTASASMSTTEAR
jgi:hypothetical protein